MSPTAPVLDRLNGSWVVGDRRLRPNFGRLIWKIKTPPRPKIRSVMIQWSRRKVLIAMETEGGDRREIMASCATWTWQLPCSFAISGGAWKMVIREPPLEK